jgi:hypothetical protein
MCIACPAETRRKGRLHAVLLERGEAHDQRQEQGLFLYVWSAVGEVVLNAQAKEGRRPDGLNDGRVDGGKDGEQAFRHMSCPVVSGGQHVGRGPDGLHNGRTDRGGWHDADIRSARPSLNAHEIASRIVVPLLTKGRCPDSHQTVRGRTAAGSSAMTMRRSAAERVQWSGLARSRRSSDAPHIVAPTVFMAVREDTALGWPGAIDDDRVAA